MEKSWGVDLIDRDSPAKLGTAKTRVRGRYTQANSFAHHVSVEENEIPVLAFSVP